MTISLSNPVGIGLVVFGHLVRIGAIATYSQQSQYLRHLVGASCDTSLLSSHGRFSRSRHQKIKKLKAPAATGAFDGTFDVADLMRLCLCRASAAEAKRKVG